MMLKLKVWAEKNFCPPPHRNTLITWAKCGRIYPMPVFIGNAYYVDEKARYVGSETSAPPRPDLRTRIAA